MPTPTTTELPQPKSWDEFEDICADLLKRVWEDPYVTRNGRSGQRQNGVDIYGLPKHLGEPPARRYAGAQCKETDRLSLETIEAEVDKAQGFQPSLVEYLILTTCSRDATLQANVRLRQWPFRVHVMFWEDISLELSDHDDLLKKHFPGWMRRVTSQDDVMEMLWAAGDDDFAYDDDTGIYTYKKDIKLRIILSREGWSDRDRFDESWVHRFPDQHAYAQPVFVHYGETRIYKTYCAYVDGGRYIVPYPDTKANGELTISRQQYKLGQFLNTPLNSFGLDYALRLAKITIQE